MSIGAPRSAVASIVSGLVHTTYTGGCGRWSGLGITRTSGILKWRPSKAKRSVVHAFSMIARHSSKRSRFSICGTR